LAVYAEGVGEERATRIVAGLPRESAIVVYSATPLAIAGPGVRLSPIGAAGDQYRYAYTGLRLLVSGNGKTVLIPVGWRKGSSNVYVLPDNDSVRIDVVARKG
jgi:hypothetical protein